MLHFHRYTKLIFISLFFLFICTANAEPVRFKVINDTYIEIPQNKGFAINYIGSPPDCTGTDGEIQYMVWKNRYVNGEFVDPGAKVEIIDPDGIARCKVQFYKDGGIGHNSECIGGSKDELIPIKLNGDSNWKLWMHWITSRKSGNIRKIKTCSSILKM